MQDIMSRVLESITEGGKLLIWDNVFIKVGKALKLSGTETVQIPISWTFGVPGVCSLGRRCKFDDLSR